MEEMPQTVIFEKKYNVRISDFHSLDEVDKFLEEKEQKKLGVVKTMGFPVIAIDIDKELDKELSD